MPPCNPGQGFYIPDQEQDYAGHANGRWIQTMMVVQSQGKSII